MQQAARLAGYRRDFTQTAKLDRLAAAGLQGPAPQGFTPLRIALLSSHTVDHLLPAIRVAGLQRRLALSLFVTPYGLYRQALLLDDRSWPNSRPSWWCWRWMRAMRRCNCR